MARIPNKPMSQPGDVRSADEKLKDDAKERLACCEAQKREFELDIRESYFFADPHREATIRSSQPRSASRTTNGQRNTSIATDLATDFVTEVMDAFMPQALSWAERKPGMFLPDEIKKDAVEAVAKQDPIIFEAIRASNLYEVMPVAFAPDLAVGTAALWIDDLRPAENFVCQSVPLRELEINIGPFGGIDDRWVVRHTKNRHVRALLGERVWDKLPTEKKKEIEGKRDDDTAVKWGYWRLWDRRDDVVWQHVVMLGDDVVHDQENVGEGSCPLIPIRFNPSAEWAYGTGPLINALEELRMLDVLEADKAEHIELQLRPPTGYPDDSFAAVENGIEAGAAYPVRPGSENAIKPIFEGGDIQAALFETAQIEDRLRAKFFLGFPQQRGKTPPTATQWTDEMLEKQRRLGTPGMSFWREGPAEIFLRFKYLLKQSGRIEDIKVNGKIVSLTPYNPAQRAAEQQEVAMATRYLEIVASAFPEEFRMEVDGAATMANIKGKMRADLVAFRKQDQRQAVIGQIQQLLQARQPAPGALEQPA